MIQEHSKSIRFLSSLKRLGFVTFVVIALNPAYLTTEIHSQTVAPLFPECRKSLFSSEAEAKFRTGATWSEELGYPPPDVVSCIKIGPCSDKARLGCYMVSFQIDRNYRKITLRWSELKEYSEETGRYKEQKLLFETSMKDFRRHPDPYHIFAFELDLRNLPHGVYKASLKGDTAEDKNNNFCELVYRFDGEFHPLGPKKAKSS
jgi:hypothetical protein